MYFIITYYIICDLYIFPLDVSRSPITCATINDKLILINDSTLSVRGPVSKGRFLLDTVFQSNCTRREDHVTMEILPEEVISGWVWL